MRRLYILGAFAITVLASLVHVACSNATEIDSGTSEGASTSYGNDNAYAGSYGYRAARDVSADRSNRK